MTESTSMEKDCATLSNLVTADPDIPAVVLKMARDAFSAAPTKESLDQFINGLDGLLDKGSKDLVVAALRLNDRDFLMEAKKHASKPAYELLRAATLEFGRKVTHLFHPPDELAGWSVYLERDSDQDYTMRVRVKNYDGGSLVFRLGIMRFFYFLKEMLSPMRGFYVQSLSSDEIREYLRDAIQVLSQIERKIAIERGEIQEEG